MREMRCIQKRIFAANWLDFELLLLGDFGMATPTHAIAFWSWGERTGQFRAPLLASGERLIARSPEGDARVGCGELSS
jgi:hypothetical protein